MLCLVAQLGNERYAIDVTQIEEVIPFVHVTVLPGAPPGVAGMIDYYGAPVPVLDLGAVTLGIETLTRMTARIIIVRHGPDTGRSLLGLLVPHATELMRCDASAFVSATIASRDARHVWDVFPDARGIVQRLDVPALLTPDIRRAMLCVEDAA